MPFAGYKDFDACVKANSDKENPEAYCGAIENKVKGEKDNPGSEGVEGNTSHSTVKVKTIPLETYSLKKK